MKINFGQVQSNYFQPGSKRLRTTEVNEKHLVLGSHNIATGIKKAYLLTLSKAAKNERCLQAVAQGHRKMVKSLVKAGARIDLKEAGSQSGALHLAVRRGQSEIIQDLVDLGCHINDRDSLGRTPLYLAVESNKPECVKALLKENANPNLSDGRNWSPLHAAAQEGQEELTQLLLEAKADPNPRSLTNDTPCDLSLVMGNTNVSRMLLQAGGEVSQSSIQDPRLTTPINQNALNLLAEFIEHNEFNSNVDLSEKFPDLMNNPTFQAAIQSRRNLIQSKLSAEFNELTQLLGAHAKDQTKASISQVSEQIPSIAQYALSSTKGSLANLMFPPEFDTLRRKLLI